MEVFEIRRFELWEVTNKSLLSNFNFAREIVQIKEMFELRKVELQQKVYCIYLKKCFLHNTLHISKKYKLDDYFRFKYEIKIYEMFYNDIKQRKCQMLFVQTLPKPERPLYSLFPNKQGVSVSVEGVRINGGLHLGPNGLNFNFNSNLNFHVYCKRTIKKFHSKIE